MFYLLPDSRTLHLSFLPPYNQDGLLSSCQTHVPPFHGRPHQKHFNVRISQCSVMMTIIRYSLRQENFSPSLPTLLSELLPPSPLMSIYLPSVFKKICCCFFSIMYIEFLQPLLITQFTCRCLYVCHISTASQDQNLYWFPRAAITNYQRLGGLIQNKCIFLLFWRPEVCNQSVSGPGSLWRL